MYMGIDRDVWGMLWSGVIGSFVAAVIGGLVALFVVRLTNRQQRKNAREGREILAMADLVAATGSMVKKYREGPNAIQDLLLVAEAATIRWGLDSSSRDLRLEIVAWPYLVGNLAMDVFEAQIAADGDGDEEFDRLLDAHSALMSVVSTWPRAKPKAYPGLVERLTVERERLKTDRATAGYGAGAAADRPEPPF